MRVAITRVDPTLPLPAYATAGASGFDLLCRIDIRIGPGEIARIPGNVIVQVPDGFVLIVALRSSTPHKKGLIIPHGIGIIDQDFRGPDDEVLIQVQNVTHETVAISRGERIAQGLLMPVERCEWEETPPAASTRGGFGSTG